MMQQGVTFFYRLFEFFDSEQIASIHGNDELKFNNQSSGAPANPFSDSKEAENDDEAGGITLFEDFSPNCAVSGAGVICFGDNNGWIKFINRDFQVFKFKSHSERIQKLFKTPNSDILIALGKHVDIPNGPVETFMHIWKLADVDELGNPKKIKSFRLFTDTTNELPISALTATSSGSQIAVGCANGVVLVFNVNLKHRTLLEKIRPMKLTKEGPHAVTGLHYLEDGVANAPLLYVITVHAIMSFHMHDRNLACVSLDRSGGCDLNCSTINDVGELIVAKSETVHIFKGEEIRGEHAFPLHKQMVCSFRRYLIVVTAIQTKMTASRMAKRVNVCIYDNGNKYVAFQQEFDDLISIISEWGSVFILTQTSLIKLRDKDLQEKLNEFFSNNLYEKAIQLARSEGCSPVKIIEYYCKYGDYLYDKGDYNQAMEQYLQTIDVHSTIEPSYVIRRFLDAQKINNLTEYLARLHKYGTPTKDHTTLLLNCYTKLKDSHKLNEFINMEDDNAAVDGASDNKKYQFDVATAIRVCREAGLLTHARSLAKQNAQHQIYLDILLEEANQSQKNLRKYQDALKYIAALPFSDAERSIRRIGKTLIENEPKGTTQLIKTICSENEKSNPEHFIHLFVRQPSELKDFLEYLIDNEAPRCSTAIYNTLLEIYIREAAHLKSKKRLSEYKVVEASIARVLRTESKYDATHALALGKMYGIESAVIYLYELLHLYHEIISHYRDREQHQKIIDTCSRFSTQDPSLWITAFTYFINKENTSDIDDEKENENINGEKGNDEYIKLCLQQISKLNLIPPLMVIELLKNSDVRLNVIREYIINDLALQNQEIETDEQTIHELEEQIQEMKRAIKDLTTKPKTFQATKCSACLAPLELPTIHFLCGHSLHERCLYNKSNPKCPKCSAKHKQTFDKQEMMQRSKGDHDSFFGQLKAAHETGDAFNTVAEYFGRGVIY